MEYQIVQTAKPSGWKWTVFLDATRTRSGYSLSRQYALFEALHVIEKATKGAEKPLAK
jgi:hypothetical protein